MILKLGPDLDLSSNIEVSDAHTITIKFFLSINAPLRYRTGITIRAIL